MYHLVPDVPRHQGICPNCHHDLVDILPVHPIFSLKAAARLLPCALNTLHKNLSKYKSELGPPLYRKDGAKRPHRYLRAWEIAFLRDRSVYMRPPGGGRLRQAYLVLDMINASTTPHETP